MWCHYIVSHSDWQTIEYKQTIRKVIRSRPQGYYLHPINCQTLEKTVLMLLVSIKRLGNSVFIRIMRYIAWNHNHKYRPATVSILLTQSSLVYSIGFCTWRQSYAKIRTTAGGINVFKHQPQTSCGPPSPWRQWPSPHLEDRRASSHHPCDHHQRRRRRCRSYDHASRDRS